MEKILVSACLLGERVRYHGGDAYVEHARLDQWAREGRLVSLALGTTPFVRFTIRQGDPAMVELTQSFEFSAAHRLHVPAFSDEKNREVFGKCNNPRGHGHLYLAEATVGGEFDERSGTLTSFDALQAAMTSALEPWQDKHLDLEMDEFQHRPSTGENIVQSLWPQFDSRLEGRLVRLRLWETANNRFTLRKT